MAKQCLFQEAEKLQTPREVSFVLKKTTRQISNAGIFLGGYRTGLSREGRLQTLNYSLFGSFFILQQKNHFHLGCFTPQRSLIVIFSAAMAVHTTINTDTASKDAKKTKFVAQPNDSFLESTLLVTRVSSLALAVHPHLITLSVGDKKRLKLVMLDQALFNHPKLAFFLKKKSLQAAAA